MTTIGQTESGPGQCAAAERGRCRRPHASPGTVRVDFRPRRHGDRSISPGRVAEGSNGRGGGGAGSAKRGVDRWLLEQRNASSTAAVGWRFGGGGSRCDSPASGGGRGAAGAAGASSAVPRAGRAIMEAR